MTNKTIEARLAEVRSRIEQLHASGEVPRLRRHLGLVDDVEQRLAQLKIRLEVVERSLAVDTSGDRTAFTSAVEAELESWDTYLERLQTNVATRAWQAREQAETAIGDVRGRRIAVEDGLAHARAAADEAWDEQRERVSAARDELERKADELTAKLEAR